MGAPPWRSPRGRRRSPRGDGGDVHAVTWARLSLLSLLFPALLLSAAPSQASRVHSPHVYPVLATDCGGLPRQRARLSPAAARTARPRGASRRLARVVSSLSCRHRRLGGRRSAQVEPGQAPRRSARVRRRLTRGRPVALLAQDLLAVRRVTGRAGREHQQHRSGLHHSSCRKGKVQRYVSWQSMQPARSASAPARRPGRSPLSAASTTFSI